MIPMSSFQPSVSPDGKEEFTFVMGPYDRSIWKSEDEAIKRILGNHLGEHKYCLKGYVIDSRKKSSGYDVFTGHCKT